MDIYHIRPVAKHLERELASCDEEENFLRGILLGDFEDFFADVVNGGNQEGDCFALRQAMHHFADEAGLADGVVGVMDAVTAKANSWAGEWFVAVGKPYDEQAVGVL